LGWIIIQPIVKTLACNVVGIGAMANVNDIIDILNVSIEKIILNKNDDDVSSNDKSKILRLCNEWIKSTIRRESLKGFFIYLSFSLFICLFIFYVLGYMWS
jgi:phosphopantothenoylcysteine synthetase/decarboxylase